MSYSATITRLPIFALFDLKGAPADLAEWAPSLPAFPSAPNTLVRDEDTELCLIGPDRFLLRADITKENDLLQMLRPAEAPPEMSIVRVSDTLTFFRVTGGHAAQIISIGCPLDLNEAVYGADAVSYTEFFGIKALVLRCDEGFDVGIEQSFGDMIEDYLNRAMA